MPDASHREQERCRRTRQSCPAVPSTAAYFRRSLSLAGETPPENASSCDPDKRLMLRQVNKGRDANAVASGRAIRYDSSMTRYRIRVANSGDWDALAEMRYQFRAEVGSPNETKSRFVQ